MLWLKTSGAAVDDAVDGRRLHVTKSGVSTSTVAPGPLADGQHAPIEMLGAAVGQVVARDRRDDDVLQAQPRGRFGQRGPARRLPGFAAGRAATAQKPQGRVQTLPRIMNVAVFCE